jgi:hypothetical protein
MDYLRIALLCGLLLPIKNIGIVMTREKRETVVAILKAKNYINAL